jgi:uncharacterized protein (TIGR02145 family)
MKKIVLAFIAIVSIFSFVHAQSDTLYIMKAGVIIDKFDVNTQIDSVIFYDPIITVTDYDGNVYKTATIGSQVWMAENLKTTHYADGTAIPLVNTTPTWDILTATSKAYCWYADDIANKATYGALYTWAAAMNGVASVKANPSGVQGVCPTGWHLPSNSEWTQLMSYLADNGHNYDGTTGGGGAKIAKSLASTSGWESSAVPGSAGSIDYPTYRNKSGFTALPSGWRSESGGFFDRSKLPFLWSSTEHLWAGLAWSLYMYNTDKSVKDAARDKREGASVRCVKD